MPFASIVLMGVESNFFVLPDKSGFRPTAAQVSNLIKRFKAQSFLCEPNSATFRPGAHPCPRPLQGIAEHEGFDWHIGRERRAGTLAQFEAFLAENPGIDIRMRWPNMDLAASGLKYPLAPVPASEGVYYDIEFHFAADTIYHTSEIIDPFEEPLHCECGAVLESFEPEGYDIYLQSRLPNRCPACDKPTDYSGEPMIVRDGWTGEEREAVGGITYRFCVVIDCGKMIPEQGATVLPEFRQIIEECLQCKTRVVQDLY